MRLKVLAVTSQVSPTYSGGAETQLRKTVEYVNKCNAGVESKVFDMWADNVEDFDVMHVFNPGNFPYESYTLANYAKRHGLKIAVTPIFYDSMELAREELGPLGAAGWRLMMSLRRLRPPVLLLRRLDPYRFVAGLFELTDSVLPNTREELRRLRYQFPEVESCKQSVIPNGV